MVHRVGFLVHVLTLIGGLNVKENRRTNVEEYAVYEAEALGETGYDVISDRVFIGNYTTVKEAEAVAKFLNNHPPRHTDDVHKEDEQ